MSSAAEKKCFRMLQEIVCERDKFCQRCGSIGPISAHHVFSRRNKGSAFEADSCLGLCLYDHAWAHKHPEAAHDLLRAKIGEERFAHLEYLSRQVVRLHDTDCKSIAAELKSKLETMQNSGIFE